MLMWEFKIPHTDGDKPRINGIAYLYRAFIHVFRIGAVFMDISGEVQLADGSNQIEVVSRGSAFVRVHACLDPIKFGMYVG